MRTSCSSSARKDSFVTCGSPGIGGDYGRERQGALRLRSRLRPRKTQGFRLRAEASLGFARDKSADRSAGRPFALRAGLRTSRATWWTGPSASLRASKNVCPTRAARSAFEGRGNAVECAECRRGSVKGRGELLRNRANPGRARVCGKQVPKSEFRRYSVPTPVCG